MPRRFLNGLAPAPPLPVTGGGTGATTPGGALANLGANSTGALSFRNRVINGNFSVNQRGAPSASTAYAAGAYVMDRWKAGANGVTLSFSAGASGDVTVSITAGTLIQIIEGPVYVPEGGAYVLSWTGTATARIYQGSASGSYAASPVPAGGLSAGANTTVELSTGTAALVQFEPGLVPTLFERRDDEYRRCQRYFTKSYAPATAPGVATSAGTGANFAVNAYSLNQSFVRFPVSMRVTPTVTPYNHVTGAAGTWRFVGAGTDKSVLITATPDGFESGGSNTWPTGDYTYPQWTASAEM